MKPEEVYVVIPTFRPRMLQWSLDNFRRQTFARKKLVIVENGPAVGACEELKIPADIVVTSERNAGAARNAGIAEVKKRDGYVCFMDDDDYYGPEYLTESVEHAKSGRIVGKSNAFIRLSTGQFGFLQLGTESDFTDMIGGPTMAFWAKEALPFGLNIRWSEDTECVNRMREKGMEVYATSRHHFMYMRRGMAHRHTFNVSDKQLMAMWKKPLYDLGKEDLAVVNGVKQQPAGTLLRLAPN